MHVLFVDDDPLVLKGIERALFTQELDWDAEFVTSADDAIRHLEKQFMDVVVTDMRMPGINGAALLETVRDRWPVTLRVILSGHTEKETALLAMNVAHQFLSKPCSAEMLVTTIQHLLESRETIQSPQLREALGRVRNLPPAPSTYLHLVKLRSQPNFTMEQVAHLVEQDPAITAKVLKLANSAFFRGIQPINSIQGAITRLGLATLMSLVLTAEAFAEGSPVGARVDHLDALRHQSVIAATLALSIAPTGIDKETASTAALLADVGLLLLGQLQSTAPKLETETRRAHAEIGAYLLGSWGLPDVIVKAVGQHHHPAAFERGQFGPTTVVHCAVALARNEDPDFDHLAELGLKEQWEVWKQQAEKLQNEPLD